MYEQLLILQVVLPLMGVLSLTLWKNKNYVKCVLFLVQSIGLVGSVVMLNHVISADAIYETVGNWKPQHGIQLKADLYATLMLVLINSIAFASSFFSFYEECNNSNFFYILFLLCKTGFCGILISNDLFNIYVFLELSSLTSYALVAAKKDKAAYKAAFEYLIIGTISATFYLIGVGLLYALTLQLNIDAIIANRELLSSPLGIGGLIFIIVGLLGKSGVFPLHRWMIQSYSAASGTVAVFLSGTGSKVSLYLMLKFIFFIFGLHTIKSGIIGLEHFILCIATTSILIGGILSLRSNQIKHILAYSSVSQIGYILLPLSLDSHHTPSLILIQIIAHALAKSSLFILCSQKKNTESHMSRFALIFNVLSICGIPITLGFAGKLYILFLALELHLYGIAVLLIVAAVITAMYSWKIFSILKEQISAQNSFWYWLPLYTMFLINILMTIELGTIFNLN